MLQTRSKWYKDRQNFHVDDLVLLSDTNTPRGHWPMGRIIRVLPDKMDKVRQVEVLSKSKIYSRPISKLCLLEPMNE